MIDITQLNAKLLSRRMTPLIPSIADAWSESIEENLAKSVIIPFEYIEQGCFLVLRSLTEDIHDDMHIWAFNMSNLIWSNKIPVSSVLRTFQLFRKVFWSFVRPTLTGSILSQDEFLLFEHQLNDTIDEGLTLAVYYCEQLVQEELQQKEETIAYLNSDRLTILHKIAATMAHELRNPLCAIEGFLKLIMETTKGDTRIKTYVDVTLHEFANLHRQITGFLSFCQKPILDEVFKEVSLTELYKRVDVLLTPRLNSENVAIDIEIEPCTFYGYEEGLLQVLVHLFNNAIDAVYSRPDKRITFTSRCTDETITMIVENNGDMIPSSIAEQLFQPFFSTNDDDNTGIGLSICKNLIEKHNGTIHCESHQDTTSFIIHIPRTSQ